MKSLHCLVVVGAFLAVAALPAQPALAQRVFVAAQGNDGNPCTFALPCRTFQHAHNTVAAGGEIDVLDPAGYGALTIAKAISIQGHGFSGVSVSSGGTGVTIIAGATDAVSLNGLLIEGSGAGSVGIAFNGGKSLVVENCVVRRMTSDGLAFNATAASLQTLSVSRSIFADNANSGILIAPSNSGPVTATIARSGLYGNGDGLLVKGLNGTGTIKVAVTDTAASNNAVGVFAITANSHSPIDVMLTRVGASGNGEGVGTLGPNARIFLAQSTVTGNSIAGYDITSQSVIASYGDNVIDDNGPNNGILSSATPKQ